MSVCPGFAASRHAPVYAGGQQWMPASALAAAAAAAAAVDAAAAIVAVDIAAAGGAAADPAVGAKHPPSFETFEQRQHP